MRRTWPGLNDYQLRAHQTDAPRCRGQGPATSRQYVSDRAAEIKEVRDEALRDFTAVRDGLEALVAEGSWVAQSFRRFLIGGDPLISS